MALQASDILSVDAITQPISDWALDYGIPANIIILRLQAGWLPTKAVECEIPTDPRAFDAHIKMLEKLKATHPPIKGITSPKDARYQPVQHPTRKAKTTRQYPTYTAHGKTMTMREWSEHLGTTVNTLQQRIYKCLPYDEVFTSGRRPRMITWQTGKQPKTYTAHGETLTLHQWSKRLGLSKQTLRSRLRKGWSNDRVFDAAKQKGAIAPTYTHAGRTLTLLQWAQHLGLSKATLYQRIQYGWPYERVFTNENFRGKQTPKGETYNVHGQCLTVREWSEYLGVSVDTLRARLRLKLPIENVFTKENFKGKPKAAHATTGRG
ncbi:hypothetical protein AAFN47_01935 [Hoeflea sp. CAU 1731]